MIFGGAKLTVDNEKEDLEKELLKHTIRKVKFETRSLELDNMEKEKRLQDEYALKEGRGISVTPRYYIQALNEDKLLPAEVLKTKFFSEIILDKKVTKISFRILDENNQQKGEILTIDKKDFKKNSTQLY